MTAVLIIIGITLLACVGTVWWGARAADVHLSDHTLDRLTDDTRDSDRGWREAQP